MGAFYGGFVVMLEHPELVVFIALYDIAVLVAIGLLAWACFTDFTTMTIPNWVSIGLITSFVFAFGISNLIGMPVFDGWKTHASALAAMFVLTFFMFVFRIWGAGDSKLASGVALWIGLKGFIVFLVVMSFVGFFLALASYGLRRLNVSYAHLGEQSWPARLKSGAGTIPYGIAIAIGAIWAFFDLGYLDLHMLIQGIR